MSSSNKAKLAGLLVCLALVLFAVGLSRAFTVQKYRDNNVTVTETTRPWDLFPAHLWRPTSLRIGGKTYRGVTGLAPYYLTVPGTNSILFVTQDRHGDRTFHVVNLATKEGIEIDGRASSFGWGIGGTRKPGEPTCDYIESAGSNRVTIVARTSDWKETMVLNLTSKVMERKETISFDTNGNVTRRSVQAPVPSVGR